MDYNAELVLLADRMAEATGRSLATIANKARCDSGFFSRMRAGKGCTVATLLRLRQWFSDNWPNGTPWPEGVNRPSPGSPTPTVRSHAVAEVAA